MDQENVFTQSKYAASSKNNEFETSEDSTDSIFSPLEAEDSPRMHCSSDSQYEDKSFQQAPTEDPPTLGFSASSSTCMWIGEDGTECGVQFPSSQSLARHVDYQHDLQKHVCMWSGCPRNLKHFDARYKLVTHLRCHTGEKPYTCPFLSCNRTFSRHENLKMHSRTHTGEKPYPCLHAGCSKRFNNTSDRAKHVKTHIERKPYPCKYPGCSKRYTDPSSMRKHHRFSHQTKQLATKASMAQHHPLQEVVSSIRRSHESTDPSPKIGDQSFPQAVAFQLKKSQLQVNRPDRLEQISSTADRNTSNVQMGISQSHSISHPASFMLGHHYQVFIPVFTPVPVPVYVKDPCLSITASSS